jgi:hypothetical protein
LAEKRKRLHEDMMKYGVAAVERSANMNLAERENYVPV